MLVFAAELIHKTIWYPTILGILVVVFAIWLFCGSLYVLLATNLGARLGFLVAAAGLTGFMLLLATLWWTSGSSGIDPPHGRSPQWKVVEIVKDPAEYIVKKFFIQRDHRRAGRIATGIRRLDRSARQLVGCSRYAQ